MIKSIKLLILVAVLAGITAVIPASAITWNAAADYHTAWGPTTNPYGPWWYGYTSNTAQDLSGGYTFSKLPSYDNIFYAHERMNGIPGASIYSGMYYNPASTDSTDTGILAHGLGLLPANTGDKPIIRFTAPSTDTYTISAAFHLYWVGQETAMTDAHVVKYVNSTNVQVLATSVLVGATPDLSYSNSLTLNAGESIDFIVGDGTNGQGYDMTRLAVTVTSGSQGTVTGTVYGPSGPLSGANVGTPDGSFSTTTAGDGSFTLTLLPGTYTLKAWKPGLVSDLYGPFTLSNGQTIGHDFELTEPSWVQVGSTLAGPYANPDNTTSTTYSLPGGGYAGVKFSPTMGDVPTELSSVPGYFRNMKITYHLDIVGNTGYGNQLGGHSGLALFLANTPDAWTGLYSGVYYVDTGVYTNRGALCANTAFSPAPGGPDFPQSNGFDVELTVVDGIATTTLAGYNSETFMATSTDVSNWAGKMKFAAFKSDPTWSNNFHYSRAFVSNVTFYKDELQAPPPTGIVSGVVTMDFGTSHPAASGATVRTLDGTRSTTTNSLGQYSLELAPGTYTLVASKPNCEDLQVTSVGVTALQTTTRDFDLTTSFIIGQVTSSITSSPVEGVTLVTTDGLASATTDSSGNYSLQVKSGAYTVSAYKYGYLLNGGAASPGVGSTATLNLALDTGWDLAADFGTTNPNGVWSYYYDDGTVVQLMDVWGWIWDATGSYTWHKYPGGGFTKNIRYTPVTTTMGVGSAYREPRKVVAESYTASTFEYTLAIARFVAPTSGYFNVSARWAGAYAGGSTCMVSLLRNGSSLFSDQLDGFAGTAENNYQDVTGTKPVLNFNQDINLAAGDVIELTVGHPVSWAQVDLTVKPAAGGSVVSGLISAGNLTGNPGIPNATVQLTKIGSTYTAVTDGTGHYSLPVESGTYQMQVSASGFTNGTATVNATTASVIQSLALTHNGLWDLSADYTTVSNPNLQWSYGFSRSMTDPLILYGNKHSFGGGLPESMNVWTYYDSAQAPDGYSPWYAWVGKNTTGSGWIWEVGGQYACVNDGEITFGGGGCWYNLGQSVGAVLPRIRWTSPSSQTIRIDLTVRSQSTGPAGYLTIARNNSIMAVKQFEGYAGTAPDYSDAFGPAPVVNYSTTVQVNPGDTIDFMQGHLSTDGLGWWLDVFGYPWRSMGLSVQIMPGTVTTATSITGLKNATLGNMVLMTTPVALISGTNAFVDNSFYIESDDRAQGMKLVGTADTPVYAAGTKITFTGSVATDAAGQKVIEIQSINSATAATVPGPLGTGSKALAASNELVRVWGNLKQKAVNTDSGTNTQWPYLYWIINDGGNDVKIKMDALNAGLNAAWLQGTVQAGHYIAVTGIATKNAAGELVVIPLSDSNFTDYSVTTP